MATKERFGKFVLLEEVDATDIGSEYRAAKLGPSGFEKIVSVVRLKTALGAHAEVAKSLLDQVKAAAQIQNPNVVKIFGIGKIDTAYYISYEFLEGKNLKTIFKRCRQEAFPLSMDHALLIASKACSALEQAHARKSETGARYFHGLVTPDNVVVTYEGEVRVRGFGYWPSRVREAGGVDEEDRRYLAPEQVAGEFGDMRADTFAVGALLYEALTGQPLFADGRDGADPAARVAEARQWNPAGDDDSLPKPIAEILRRSLAGDPAKRYAEIQEMRKAVDTLLFSGDFTPTTFNLAFFMHSLFRDDIERESRRLKEEREASYAERVSENTPTPPAVPAPVAAAVAAAAVAPAVPPQATAAAASPPVAAATAVAPSGPPPKPPSGPSATLPLIPPPPRNAPIRAEAGAHPPATPPPAADSGAGLTAKEAAAGFTFHKEEGQKKPKAVVAGGIAAAVLLAAVAGWLVLRRSAPPPPPATTPPSTLSAEAVAAMQRVKELEEKLNAIEAEKAAAEAKAAEDAKKKVEAQAAARGQKADAAAVERAQEEARRRAQAEADRKAQEEKHRLEEEQRAAEARLAEERRRAAEEAARVAAAATPVPATAPPAAAVEAAAPPALKAGALVSLNDPGVIAPVTQAAPPLRYPPIAERQRVEGTVELSILVDERGNVVDARVVTAAGGKAGLNEAAVDNVRRRRYRPATKDGIPVKVWYPVSVRFVLPR
jgi:serine/threonine-protein kinase